MDWTKTVLRTAFAGVLFSCNAGAALADAPPLRPLDELTSVNGVLDATLEARAQKVDLGAVSFDGTTYNGDYAGPLLRVSPGDVMHIKLVNRLTDPTNLHFHGLHTSPLGNGDDIYIVVKPGESFDYDIKISPDQPPGLYWYHPHIHGISDRLVNGGLSGALLVDGLKRQIPALAAVKEQTLILKMYETDAATDLEMKRLHKLVQTINGQLMSAIAMHKGETQLWQILNPGSNYYFHLSLKGHKFRVIAWDGVATNKETLADRLDIGPATRVAVLVDAGDQAGNFDLVSEQTPTGIGAERTDDRVLGSVVVDNGAAVPGVAGIATFPAKNDWRGHKIDAYRTFTFSENALKGEYYINGKMFGHDRVDTRVPLGNVEEWTIRNDSDDMHVFHIHQMHFQVVEINGQKQDFNGYLDTVRVPERGEVKLIMPFTDPTMIGEFVYHCHVLLHEDKGMMANIEVYDPKKENVLSNLWRDLAPRARAAGRICGDGAQTAFGKIKAWLQGVTHT